MKSSKSVYPLVLRHADGRERTVSSQSQQVAAEWDGFVAPEAPTEPSARPRTPAVQSAPPVS